MKYLIIANWKMNPGTAEEAQEIFEKIKNGISGVKDVEVVLCPPFVYLSDICGITSDNIKLGVQDIFWETKGAYTGEVSPSMIKNGKCDCGYVIVGHSERRINLNETNEMVNKKIKSALGHCLKPILCVGDKSRESKEDFAEVITELEEGLKSIDAKDLKNIIIAYEPLWAISTMGGRPATPEDIKESAGLIREKLTELYGEDAAENVKILYGGSVNSGNIKEIIYSSGVSGALVGAASLNPDEFIKIVNNI